MNATIKKLQDWAEVGQTLWHWLNNKKTAIGAAIVTVMGPANEIAIVLADGSPPVWWDKTLRISLIAAAFFGVVGLGHKGVKALQ